MIELYTEDFFMKEALKEAQKAFDKDEIPVGAVVVCNKRIIARAHNMTEQLNDATAHAEMLAITAAENALGTKFLNDCEMYITLEPCTMCAGALHWTRMGKIIYAASDDKKGYSFYNENITHPKTIVKKGIMSDPCGALMTKYFQNKRKK